MTDDKLDLEELERLTSLACEHIDDAAPCLCDDCYRLWAALRNAAPKLFERVRSLEYRIEQLENHCTDAYVGTLRARIAELQRERNNWEADARLRACNEQDKDETIETLRTRIAELVAGRDLQPLLDRIAALKRERDGLKQRLWDHCSPSRCDQNHWIPIECPDGKLGCAVAHYAIRSEKAREPKSPSVNPQAGLEINDGVSK